MLINPINQQTDAAALPCWWSARPRGSRCPRQFINGILAEALSPPAPRAAEEEIEELMRVISKINVTHFFPRRSQIGRDGMASS